MKNVLFLLMMLTSLYSYAQQQKKYLIMNDGDTVQAKILQGKEGGKLLVIINGEKKILNANDYQSIYIETIDLNLERYGNSGSSGLGFFGLGIISGHIRPKVGANTVLDLRAQARLAMVQRFVEGFCFYGFCQDEGYFTHYIPGGTISIGTTFYGEPFLSNGRVKRHGMIARVSNTFSEMNEQHLQLGISMEHFNKKLSYRSVNYELCLGIYYTTSSEYKYFLTNEQVGIDVTFGIILNHYN